jgi:hypothetical protein
MEGIAGTLVLPGLLASALWGGPALAASLGDSGVVAILPVGEVVGDGATVSNLHLLALKPDGTPHLGAKLKTTVSAGSAGEAIELGAGLYQIPFTPPLARAATKVTVDVRARTVDRLSFDVVRVIEVEPASVAAVEVRSNPERLVLSQDAAATLSFQVPPGSGDPPVATDLLVRVSSGAVSDIVSLGNGRFTARYTPPQVNYPHLAIVTVVDRRNPLGVRGHVGIPLQGKVSYPVTTTPGASVILRIGDREFGPTKAGSDGQATVDIIVPPGTAQATMVSIADGAPTESTLDLRVPEVRRLQLFPLQPGIPSDARTVVPVRAVVLTPGGQADVDAKINMTATAGRLSRPVHLGNGVYEAIYTPPDGRTQMAATIQATVPGGTKQSDDVELTLIPALPSSLVLTPEPARLAEEGTGLRVFGRLLAIDGAGLSDRTLRVVAAGAQIKGEVQDLKGGDYRIDMTADQGTDVDVHVTALAQPSGNAIQRVLLFPEDQTLPSDGITSRSVLIVTADEFGYPVPDVKVDLSVIGGGSLPSTVTTDGRGLAQVFYTAGSAPGLVSIEARAGGQHGATSILLGLPDLALKLPVSGAPADVRASELWSAMQASVHVEREGATGATSAAIGVASGVLSALTASAEPAVVAPGGTVVVKVKAVDEAGRGVSGTPLDFFATGGARFGQVRDLGGGEYQSELTVPADAVDEVKVSVLSAGGITTVVRIQVSATGARADGSPWATDTTEPAWGEPAPATAATETPAPDPVPATKPTKVKPEPGEHPWLRGRAGFVVSTYAYSQQPGGDAGSLLPTELSWGGGDGGAAIPLGGEFVLRGYVPKVPYIGFLASFRGSRYSVASPTFSEDAVDTLFSVKVDLAGRVPIPIGASELSLAARVGFRYDDFITFRGCTDPGCVVSYEPLGLPGLDVGFEVGAEFWKMYALVAASGGFAYGSVPYAVGVDANLGFQVHKHVFVDAGFGWQLRDADLEGADSGTIRGTLTDQMFTGSLGVGFSL